MKVVILAGGLGTRISEETASKPKPMIEIGGRPIIWHIMKIYSHYGVNDFIICCGYKSYVIKEYFKNYSMHLSDVTFDIANDEMIIHRKRAENWRVTLVDTGDHTMTGGRLLRVADYLQNEDTFCLTYGDGVSDLDIAATIDFHNSHGKEATVTAVIPPGRFGALDTDDDGQVKAFIEKPRGDGSYINGGFFVLNRKVIDRISGDQTVWEADPMFSLVDDQQLMSYKHDGFWQPMDTLRERTMLENMWNAGEAQWKVWP